MQITLRNGVDSAIGKYFELKVNHEREFNWHPYELNKLGLKLLEMNMVKDAIEVFKLNIKEYPKASKSYNFLGEAYAIDGQKDLAIKYYKKSLELNPNNKNAEKMLVKLNQ